MFLTASRIGMKITQKSAVILVLLAIFCIIIGIGSACFRSTTYSLKQLELDDENRSNAILDEDTSYLIKQVREITRNKYKIKYIKARIAAINERQHVGYVNKLNSTALLKAMEAYKNATGQKLETVLVIQVHGNSRYVKVLLQSLERVVGIHESLLIFAHDYYDVGVYNILNNVHFARVMQIFYPYSVQLHPYRFPGEDVKFCPRLFECIFSNERDPIRSQAKHFWWWIANEVFDNVEILKNYKGFIYFLEVEQYLTKDFILIAKKLEQKQPVSCPDCQILSLAARPPKPEQYRPENTSVIISVWGWTKTKYIKTGIAFNRTLWNEIKSLKEEFCYFDDFTWDNSLKHLALKSQKKQFFMMSIDGPRIFKTNDCWLGNGSSCDITSTYKDILKFIRMTSRGLFPSRFTLEFDSLDGIQTIDEVKENGGWDDARDRELCMFIASNGRRVYY